MRMPALVAISIAIAACAPQQPMDAGFTEEDRADITALIGAWDASFSANDHEGAVERYASDYVEVRPDGIRGRAAALELYSGFTINIIPATSQQYVALEIVGQGDLVFGQVINASGAFEFIFPTIIGNIAADAIRPEMCPGSYVAGCHLMRTCTAAYPYPTRRSQ